MKKIAMLLVFVLLFGVFSSAAYATGPQSANVEPEIDMIIAKMNAIILEKKQLSENPEKLDSREILAKEKELETKYTNLEDELFDLGAKLLDPSDSAYLDSFDTSVPEGSRATPPDFAMLANAYSIYAYDGTYTYNGVNYPYRYLKVVDDKGYNQLTLNQHHVMLNNATSTLPQEILEYNFGYLTGMLIGSIPYVGSGINWTLGMLNTLLENPNATVSGTGDLYHLTIGSITSMTYYYVSDPTQSGTYCHAGTRANNISFSATHGYSMNVNGNLIQGSKITPFSGSSGSTIHSTYIKWYADHRTAKIDTFGSLRIRGYHANYTFTPKFASLPSALI